MSDIRVVCFDLGGVLLRIRHSWAEVLEFMGQQNPVEVDGGLAHYVPLSEYQAGVLSEDDYLACVAGDLNLDVEGARRAHGLILREEYDGARELVQSCLKSGREVYCLSNTNELHYREFFNGRFPVCEAFTELLASHRIRHSKPDEAAFRIVEDRSGHAGEEIVFFDDSMVNVEAARRIGWVAECVDPRDPIDPMRQHLKRLGVL
ncbi:HAD-IA family hydrolase [Kamptonema cortianum]|nr:HAD-IA family hydrolase [Geitlerinema splendidum]MDK3155865.1 HAD-IA family hydrolase [Kamptonema cortianum]